MSAQPAAADHGEGCPELPPAASAASLARGRTERTLPLPFVSPRVRSRLLLDEAMAHNWKLHGEAFRRFVAASEMPPSQQQETFEMIWFRFRMEWRQLYADALSEVDSIDPPQLTGVPSLDHHLLAEYQQEATAAFYPVVMMELFQKEVTFDQPVHSLTANPRAAEQRLGGSRSHWAQLYSHELQVQSAACPQTVLLSLPAKRDAHDGANAKSYDDLSSVGGFSDNSSFASSSLSPTPSPELGEPSSTPAKESQSPAPTSRRLQVLLRMASTEAPTAPIDYNAVKYDADVRNGIVSGRRERMRTVLSALL